MTCRVQAGLQCSPPAEAMPLCLELAELSYLGSRGMVSATVKLRRGDRTGKGQSAADRQIEDRVYAAIADAARALDLFAHGDLPTLQHFQVERRGPGADAAHRFTVVVAYRGHLITARLCHDDLLEGFAAAFVAAFNQLLAGQGVRADPADDIGEGYMASD